MQTGFAFKSSLYAREVKRHWLSYLCRHEKQTQAAHTRTPSSFSITRVSSSSSTIDSLCAAESRVRATPANSSSAWVSGNRLSGFVVCHLLE